jgi:NAD-dependent SIR2 family protein deacetylase
MRTRKDVQKEEDRLIEQDERIRLAQQYPTCLYAGKELRIRIVFNEEVEPDWDIEAQYYININKGRACCLHKGKYHLLYY